MNKERLVEVNASIKKCTLVAVFISEDKVFNDSIGCFNQM